MWGHGFLVRICMSMRFGANREVGIIERVEFYESTRKLLEYVQISLCGTFKTAKFLVVGCYVLLRLFVCSL